MSYPDSSGPFQIMYQTNFEKWDAIGVAYTWEQVNDMVIHLLTEEDGFGVDYIFVLTLNKDQEEFWVETETNDPLTLRFYKP